ncbi:hypothetical protein BJP62_03955 [Jeongeupia sp. USM3]|nr:hypothetical protein BJP62_03955 [Jeongeupia sp. USM3]
MEVLSVRTRDAGLGSDVASGVFAVAKWRVIDAKPIASIPVQVAVPPLAPQAPPLPFRFLGRLVEEGKVTIFLQNKEQSVVVRVGDTIDEQYKVESLDDGILTLRYLPLNQVQTLDVGSQS